MNDKLKEFMSKVEADEALNAQFEEICQLQDASEARARVVGLAREAGIDLQEADLDVVKDMDDSELLMVAGGRASQGGSGRPKPTNPVFM